MTKHTPLDIMRALSCGMDDSDYLALIEFAIEAIDKQSNLFKAEKIIKDVADYERLPFA